MARHGDVVRAHPLAGTTPRTGDPTVDAQLAAQLIASTKDQVEHRVTIEMVHDTLLPWCSYVDWEAEPSVVTVANVQHLGTARGGPPVDAAAVGARAGGRPPADAGARRLPAGGGAGRHRRAGAVRSGPLRRPGRLGRRQGRRRVGRGHPLRRDRRATRPGCSPGSASWPAPTPTPSWPRRRPSSRPCCRPSCGRSPRPAAGMPGRPAVVPPGDAGRDLFRRRVPVVLHRQAPLRGRVVALRRPRRRHRRVQARSSSIRTRPATPTPVLDAYARKFGGPEEAARIMERVTPTAAPEGLDFHLEVAQRANTFDAHRLIGYRRATGACRRAMKERLLQAYFVEGRDVGDHEPAGRSGRRRRARPRRGRSPSWSPTTASPSCGPSCARASSGA